MAPNRNLTHDIGYRTQRVAALRGCAFVGPYWYWFSAGVPAAGS